MTRRRRKTRGKSRSGRLRTLDTWLTEHGPTLPSPPGAVAIDLGTGDLPYTTLEWATALRRRYPELSVIGVEHDPHRLRRVQPHASDHVDFRLGGFELPLTQEESPAIIRCMNVLRDYPADTIPAIHRTLLDQLAPHGLLLEGTSNRGGDVLTAFVLRPEHSPGLVFLNRFEQGFAPWMFRDRLPQLIRRSVEPGAPIHRLLSLWDTCWRETSWSTPEEAFIASTQRLSQRLPGIRASHNALWVRDLNLC